VRQKAHYDAPSIQCQSGTNVSSEPLLKRDRWLDATHSAMQSLAVNIATYMESLTGCDGWAQLGLEQFPCQKTDAEPRCEGWVRLSQGTLYVPGQVSPCPCSLGRRSLLSPLLSVARELSAELSLTELKMSFQPCAFQRYSHDSGMRSGLMLWLHWAAQRRFHSLIDSGWTSQWDEHNLTHPQRLTLKWWARMTELSQLVQNQVFTVLTRSTLEQLHREGQAVSLHRALSQIPLKEGSLIVLFLNGQELSRSTHQSGRLDWLDAFFSALDERELGLVVLSKHPLFGVQDSDSFRKSGFRWRPHQAIEQSPLPFERLLPRGSWDRFLELLARADHILSQTL
jgi:hypothetical protein